ncbi:MAG TPA: hypothetical protein VLT33_35700, partial [Labilithrix sp.]|nr:hypothetical protein [Labilithrix sp.]
MTGAALIGLAASAGLRSLPSCGPSFEPPCRVVDHRTIDPAAPAAMREGPVSISEGTDGEIIIVSFASAERLDAGAADAADSGSAATFV